MKKMPGKQILSRILLAILIIAAAYGLVVVAEFIGYASSTAEAGRITELVLEFTETQNYYGAVAGVAVRVDGFTANQSALVSENQIEKENLIFDCLNPDGEQEIYASHVPFSSLDLSTVAPATTAEVDAFSGLNSSSIISASNTYTESFTITLDTQTITNVPGTRTFTTNLGQSNFTTLLLKDANDNLIFASMLTNFTNCFDSSTCNFQFLLPIANQTSQIYHFWRDPGDNCPSGESGGRVFGSVIGNVTDDAGNPLEGVIVDVAGFTALSGTAGFYNLTTVDGTYSIFAIKEGFQTYQSNATVFPANTTVHNIAMIAEVVINPNTGTGVGPGIATQTGTGSGTDVGPGEAPSVPLIEQPKKIEGQDYVININEIRKKIRMGSFVQEILRFFSFKSSSAQAFLEINGTVKDLIDIDKDQFTIDPDGAEQVTVTMFGKREVGIYNGTISVLGDINATIPVEIEVLPKDKIPVEALLLDIETSEKKYIPGSKVKLKADLRNMLTDKAYPVTLFFSVQNEKGDETIWTFGTNVFLRTSFSIIKSFPLPRDLEPGDYILRVTANYLGLNSGTSTIFKVQAAFYSRSIFGFPVWGLILILLLIGLAVGAFFYIRKRIEAKKRYHLKVDHNTLPKPGPRSIFVGKIAETDHKTYFNMEKFKVHTIVAGSTGGGKSVSAQVVIEEMLGKDIAVVVFDPTAQWSGMLRKCKDKGMLSLYSFFGMKASEAKAFNGNIREITDAREVVNPMDYAKPGEIQVFACHRLDPKDMDIVVASAIREMFRSNLQESKPLRLMLVFDEVHRLLPKFGGSGQGFLQIERACREFRKWGLGVLLISQVLSDFVGTIKANINTEIQMRTRDEGDLERIRQKYGEEVLRSLTMATVGSGMVENPAYNNGKPFFVAFKPLLHSTERLTDEEISEYSNYNNQIDDLQYSLKQLEEKNVDVFDLKLELKLALDKVKTGNFNVVNVYLEGLRPRIDKEWQKIGMTPKKLEKKMVSMEELEAEFQTAQKERSDYEEKQKKEGKSGQEEEKKGPPPWKTEVAPDKILNLSNGMIVLSQQSLYDEVSAMKDEDFEKHVNEQKNDFSEWIENAIGDKELAGRMKLSNNKKKILELLECRKNKQELPALSEEDKKKLQEATSQQSPAPAASPPALPQETGAEYKKEDAGEAKKPATEIAAGEAQENKEREAMPKQEDPKPEEPGPAPKAEEAQGAANLEQLIADDPSKYFKLENGKEIKSVAELKEYLKEMPEDMFKSHVGTEYNHFADWIEGVFQAKEVADSIRQINDKDQMAEAL